MHPLNQLAQFGQAVWLDDIHRQLITGGELKRLVEEDGLKGMTSNPAIFQKAISESSDYDADIRELRGQSKGPIETFEALSVRDVQMAADVFRPLHERTGGEHGYVSLEVNPHLARDTEGTIEEARRLWAAVNRPNVFIKVPGTREGLPAIERLISEGININVTLLFGLPRYREVARAYAAGIDTRLQRGEPVERLRSVASFFLSRIDAMVDPKLEALIKQGGSNGALARQLRGEVALASAKTAYQIYKEDTRKDRWQRLAAKGAQPQWLLWASTSTKNPEYSDVKYVEPLIGRETINTMPMETLEAFRDHGKVEATLEAGMDHAQWVLEELPKTGVSLEDITQQLEDQGIEKFCKPFDSLIQTLEKELVAA
jgi:transaldolase